MYIKVKEFPNWGEPTLMELCYRIKPTFYVDGTLVVREGDPISEILFLLNGELWTYTSRATDHCNNDKDHLVDGDFFGKELVTWVQGLQADSYTSRLPASTKTVKALKNVEAFLLTAYDLKEIFIEHKQQQAEPEINPEGQ
ncbi:putative cyclic nucleotide-gated ion channel 8 [Pistacia vera]|uniref:putative cyclic nucleotide-gated ion channel 8 n=1 Tax=Pistacia vera TaxID=55513 RepID=UPI001262B1B3|nr:putative cyclic nucleotide-gated ion channel 8 [Pistacia vera]